jgi:ADP-ribosylglycohydrolase
MEKLRNGFPPRRVALGTMPSSSSAMSIWPVGLVNAGDPRAAADQAYALAALIHVGEVDFCQDAAAAVAAAVAVGLRPDTTARATIDAALAVLHPVSGQEMHELILEAVALAAASEYETFREGYRARFGRPIMCDARETVPATFALTLLADGDVRRGVELAVNLGGDTDTIATMTGAICGAIGGPDAIAPAWVEELGPAAVADAREVAEALVGVARAKVAERARLAATVPGLLDPPGADDARTHAEVAH